jgi:hypothetical protein
MADSKKLVWTISGIEESAMEVIPNLLPLKLRSDFRDEVEARIALVKYLRERYLAASSAAVAANEEAAYWFRWADDCPYRSVAHAAERDGFTWQDVASCWKSTRC